MTNNHSILVVNQSSELYGSDRSLLDFIKGLSLEQYSIVVCLPGPGPLLEELQKINVEVVISPVGKITRSAFTPLGFITLLSDMFKAFRIYSELNNKYKFRLVYSNTLAILAPAFWSRLNKIKHVWHVREIITKPQVVAKGLCYIAERFSERVIFNSQETCDWFHNFAGRTNLDSYTKHSVIWNGVAMQSLVTDEEKKALRQKMGFDSNHTIILMVGRINAWKGQDVLIEAINLLAHDPLLENVKIIFLGSAPPGQDQYIDQLNKQINESPVSEKFMHNGFVSEVADYYRIADISVVPSKEPEPFGRVAIEAMAYGVPVVAANHGGLREIIKDGETGILVIPKDAISLSYKLRQLIESSESRYRLGQAGRLHQQAFFSVASYRRNLEESICSVIEG